MSNLGREAEEVSALESSAERGSESVVAQESAVMNRRRALKLIGAAGLTPLAGGFEWSAEDVANAAVAVEKRAAAANAYAPDFFTPHEWETVRVLVDLVIPADGRSGSATDAGVPEFIDFMMLDGSEGRRRTMREGLVWLDGDAQRRFGTTFLAANESQRRAILDDIAWPARAPAELQAGVGWFNSFRDLTGAGFFSSRMGYEDLQYIGNQVVPVWDGCAEPALRKLGVSYSVMETRR